MDDDAYGAGPQTYAVGPDSLPTAGVPTGVLHEGTLKGGTVYPGVDHVYSVYLPAGHDGSALPLTIFLDGRWVFLHSPTNAAVVLDNLIHAGAIPPMMAIFIDAGVAPALGPAQQARWERSFEYDSLSARYSQFLLDELIPAAGAYSPISSNPEDTAVVGLSTGAVGAFIAAWHRPDRIRRVMTFVGTFVAMRGADTLPELVRKTEPKPLKVWLHAGRFDHITRDQPYGTFYAGSWPTASTALFHALQFSGYDAKLTMGEGEHNLEHAAAILPQALRELWSGRSAEGERQIIARPPAALGAPGWDARGSVWSTIVDVDDWIPVPISGHGVDIAVDSAGGLVVVTAEGSLTRVGAGTPIRESGVRAVAAGGGDDLYVALTQGGIIVPVGDVIAPGARVRKLLWDGSGHVYVLEEHSSRLGVVDATAAAPEITWFKTGLVEPSSLGISPDLAQLIVTDAARRTQWSFLLDPTGKPVSGEPFFRMETLDDPGAALDTTTDSTGRVYFATPLGVQVCEPIGRVAMILNPPRAVGDTVGVEFAGPGRSDLYVLQNADLWKRPMKVHGTSVQSPVMPPAPPL